VVPEEKSARQGELPLAPALQTYHVRARYPRTACPWRRRHANAKARIHP